MKSLKWLKEFLKQNVFNLSIFFVVITIFCILSIMPLYYLLVFSDNIQSDTKEYLQNGMYFSVTNKYSSNNEVSKFTSINELKIIFPDKNEIVINNGSYLFYSDIKKSLGNDIPIASYNNTDQSYVAISEDLGFKMEEYIEIIDLKTLKKQKFKINLIYKHNDLIPLFFFQDKYNPSKYKNLSIYVDTYKKVKSLYKTNQIQLSKTQSNFVTYIMKMQSYIKTLTASIFINILFFLLIYLYIVSSYKKKNNTINMIFAKNGREYYLFKIEVVIMSILNLIAFIASVLISILCISSINKIAMLVDKYRVSFIISVCVAGLISYVVSILFLYIKMRKLFNIQKQN